jgi:L-iditol 2-dehydrogenase
MQSAAIRDSAPLHHVVACKGGGVTMLERRPVPVPGPGEMLLRLNVAGFCGTDLFKLVSDTALPGAVLGHELVGTVVMLGGGVTRFAEGDRIVVPHHVPCGDCVFCLRGNETMCAIFKENLLEPGGFADTILVRRRATAQAAHKVPDTLVDENAVFVEPAACVLRGVDRSGLDPAGAAVVLGAGSMGLLHILVLKAVAPDVAIVAVDPDSGRRQMAESLGARSVAPGSAAHNAVRAISKVGADAVFDTVGGPEALNTALALTRPGGAAVLFAHAPHKSGTSLDLNDLFKSERRIIATYSGALKEQQMIFDLLVRGRLDPSPLVTHKMPLDDFEAGVALVKQRQALKVLFTPSRAAMV